VDLNSSTSSSSVGRFAARVTLACVVVCLLYGGIVAAVSNSGPRTKKRFARWTNLNLTVRPGSTTLLRLRELRDASNLDVLFLGSSHCYCSFDTEYFARMGLRTFNMGTAGQHPVITRWLFDRNVDRLAPKLIVYEAYDGNFTGDGVESYFDICQNVEMDSGLVRLGIELRDVRATNALVGRLLEYDRIALNDVEPRLPALQTYVAGGYVRIDDYWDGTLPNHSGTRRFRPRQFEQVAAVVEGARSRGIPIVFVVQPLPKAARNWLPGLRERKEFISRFAAKLHVPIYRFEGLPLDDQKHFADDDHLNADGVAIFGPSVYRTLTEQGHIPKR
jgi:hypothetical protein